MTELERAQRAIGAAMAYLRDKNDPDAVGTLEYINAMLNPPPEYEEVEEIVGWVNVYQKEDGTVRRGETRDTEEQCNEFNLPPGTRICCQPIKVTVRREKRVPKELTGKLTLYDDGSYCLITADDPISRVKTDLEGAFTWQEEP